MLQGLQPHPRHWRGIRGFADASQQQQFIQARRSSGDLYDERPIKANTWSFLGILSEMSVVSESGFEMFPNGEGKLSKLLETHLPDSQFSCVLQGSGWTSLATNKFGSDVARSWPGKKKGVVIVIPQLARKGPFLVELLTDVLPAMAPDLFPQTEGALWIHRSEYESPECWQSSKKKPMWRSGRRERSAFS